MDNFNENKEKLNKRIKELLEDKFVLAFSGGVDSSLILKLASDLREEENDVVAIMYNTNTTPDGDLDNAQNLANEMEVKLEVVNIDVFDNEHIKNNHRQMLPLQELSFRPSLQTKG